MSIWLFVKQCAVNVQKSVAYMNMNIASDVQKHVEDVKELVMNIMEMFR